MRESFIPADTILTRTDAPERVEESLSWLFARTRAGARRDPGRMRELIAGLGLTEPPRSALVVGTNGKGTVTSMIAGAVSAGGGSAGAFTSPHVERFNERIAVAGEHIPDDEIVRFTERAKRLQLLPEPAFFELTLALALAHFRSRDAEFAAFEAGVGARYDATAVLDNVVVTVVTPIALDHQEILGPDVATIALDKAAALRPGVPAVSAPQPKQARAVLEGVATDIGAPLHFDAPDDPLFELPEAVLSSPLLADPVRRRNARTAAAALRVAGLVDEGALVRGLLTPPLPARGERFSLPGGAVILDGAHDPAAATALLERLAALAGNGSPSPAVGGGDRSVAMREASSSGFTSRFTHPPFTLLFGALPRKQGEATLRILESRAQRVFVTRAGGQESSLLPAPGRTFLSEPAAALTAALAAREEGQPLVVAGSLYLAGELRPLLRGLADSNVYHYDDWEAR